MGDIKNPNSYNKPNSKKDIKNPGQVGTEYPIKTREANVRINEALFILNQYSGKLIRNGGLKSSEAQNQQWLIDQMIRTLLRDEYKTWREKHAPKNWSTGKAFNR